MIGGPPTPAASAVLRWHAWHPRTASPRALLHHEFVLHYQPFVELATGRTTGSESLLRWDCAGEGLLLPGRFLAPLESGPLIDEVGRWVLDSALVTQARWQRLPGFEDHRMSVNLSVRQLGRGHFPDSVRNALARHGVAPRSLGLEVLEDSLVKAGARAAEELLELSEMGVSIAIDDFGVGYSSIAYLQRFHVDVLKIDRELLSTTLDPRAVNLLRAIGDLAHSVGAQSVAEGAQTRQQFDLVNAAGIDAVQGYLLARPAPAGDGPVTPTVPV